MNHSLWDSRHRQLAFDTITGNYDFTDKEVFVGGCGDGDFERRLENAEIKSKQIVGMDISLNAILRAKIKTGNTFYLVGDIGRTKFFLQYFDVAVLIDVLHHVADPRRVLFEMSRIARDLVIYEANRLNPIRRWNGLRAKLRGESEGSFYKWWLKRELESLGYDVRILNTHFVPSFCPEPLAELIYRAEGTLEKISVVKELSGALFVVGRR